MQVLLSLRIRHGVERASDRSRSSSSILTKSSSRRECRSHRLDRLPSTDSRRRHETDSVSPLFVGTDTFLNQLELNIQQLVHVSEGELEGVHQTDGSTRRDLNVSLASNSGLSKRCQELLCLRHVSLSR